MRRYSRWEKIIRALIIVLPCSVFFSYQPLFYFGSDRLMNFELSLPLLMLVVFDVVAIIYGAVNWRKFWPKLPWQKLLILVLLPAFALVSVAWSMSKVHGVLATGILWLIMIAVVATCWLYKEFFEDAKYRKFVLKFFLIFSVLMSVVCWVQCILDVAGLGRDYTLMCAGCTYQAFGFPHPNGFMAEPQYMGGVLLAPVLISLYMVMKKNTVKRGALALFLTMTLFLTMSRGAIYAFVVAFAVMLIWGMIRRKSAKPLMTSIVAIAGFMLTLNAQGVLAEFSPTNDTYITGISKVINQLSLGIIKIEVPTRTTGAEVNETVKVDVLDAMENEANDAEVAVQDGYVPESTNGRLTLAKASYELWKSKPNYAIFGVGIGAAGATIYHDFVEPGELHRENIKKILVEAGVDDPSLNVQSEYAEVLVEFGLVGVTMVILVVILVVKELVKHPHKMLIFTIGAAYLVAMLFCSGLTNSLYLYLFVPFLAVLLNNDKKYETLGIC